jgi:hypothetical protein
MDWVTHRKSSKFMETTFLLPVRPYKCFNFRTNIVTYLTLKFNQKAIHCRETVGDILFTYIRHKCSNFNVMRYLRCSILKFWVCLYQISGFHSGEYEVDRPLDMGLALRSHADVDRSRPMNIHRPDDRGSMHFWNVGILKLEYLRRLCFCSGNVSYEAVFHPGN